MAAKAKRRSGSIFKGLFVALLLVLIGVHLYNLREQIKAAEAEKAALDRKISTVQQENNSLEAALEKADDPEYLQEQAREQFDMVTPGEKTFYDVSK